MLSTINVFTNLEDGVLDIESQPVSVLDGSLLGNLRLDARSSPANFASHLTIDQVNVLDLTSAISQLNSVTGKLNLQADYTATGGTVNEIIDSLSGAISFVITDNSVDIGVIKQVFTAIAALSPTGEAIQQWPDEMSFSELSGYILLNNGIDADQEVKLRMDNFDVTGTGGLDLQNETFTYALLFTVLGAPHTQTIQINERFHDISWPVQCNSAFADSVTQYCRPDFTQVRQLFVQMGSNEVKLRLDEVVTDQVPEQLQDSARGLLRSIFDR